MKVVDIRLENITPGPCRGVIPVSKPRISWSFEGSEQNWEQENYQIKVLYEGDREYVEYEPVKDSKSHFVEWPGSPLDSRGSFDISVRVSSKSAPGTFSEWSEPVKGQVGILSTDEWPAKFIAMKDQPKIEGLEVPETLFRKDFKVKGDIVSAKLFSTSGGIYEIEINGKRISDDYLSPGWTTYESRVLHQFYDPKDSIQIGENTIGVRVASGWYSGFLGFCGTKTNFYGYRRSISLELTLQYEDGSKQVLTTDESWKSSDGPITSAQLYSGEDYDANLEIKGWSEPQCDYSSWNKVEVTEIISPSIEPQSFPYVRPIKTLSSKRVFKTPKGKSIVDFGENSVGFVSFSGLSAPKGHKLTFRHAEVMENGELGTRPLRGAQATDSYIFKGTGSESYHPRFTFHGFRYCEVTNWPNNCDLADLKLIVISTDFTQIGGFECDNSLLNQLHDNVVRSSRGNFVAIPTDCPQRDERLGWTGDISAFSPTASFLFDCNNFLQSWLKDVWCEQLIQNEKKLIPFVPPATVPDILKYCDSDWNNTTCAIWQDCTVIVPDVVYEYNDDLSVLKRQFESMIRWYECIPKRDDKLLWSRSKDILQLGDWLDPTAPPENPLEAVTDATLVADEFLYKILCLITKISKLLGYQEDYVKYKNLRDKCKKDFESEYIEESGHMVNETQTAYSLAICFGLYDDNDRLKIAGERLAEIVEKGGFKIGTGFAGTPFVTHALTLTGHSEKAYSMLLEKKCPSWLYPITMGATTIWERWDSMLEDGTINPGEMTSFNHYALGSVATFMHETIGGLKLIEPGYKRFEISPIPGGNIKSANVYHESPYGKIVSEWKITEKDFALHVEIPFNTKAVVILPNKQSIDVGSGSYDFSCKI